MEYQVPQFVEVENKVVGSLSLRQFIYIAGTIGLCVVFVFLLPLWLALVFSLPVIVFGAALSFYKYNGKPFIEIVESAFNYYTRDKFFLWRHETPVQGAEPTTASITAAVAESRVHGPATPKLTRGKLSDLAWSLDVNTGNTVDSDDGVGEQKFGTSA